MNPFLDAFPYPWSTSQRNIFSVSGLQLQENNHYDGPLGANSGWNKGQLFHPFQQSRQSVKVYRVGVDVEQSAVTVDELVGGITFHSDKFFDGVLLLVGQVVVIPRLVLTRYPTEIIISRLYIVISRLTMRFPSCRTCRNFRHVDISFNSLSSYIFWICSKILVREDLNNSAIWAWVSQTVSFSRRTSICVYPSSVW